MKRVIISLSAPAAIGPYNQAIEVNDTLYVSGQIPIVPVLNEICDGGIVEQTIQVFSNLNAILSEAGYSFADVVKTTVMLADMNDFARMNEVYAKFFSCKMPARATFEVSKLPRDARIEIDLIAVKTKSTHTEPELSTHSFEKEYSQNDKSSSFHRKPFRM